ncbi:MAG: trypsin-like peptidase domain-containing protein [Burkholderiales bacterium]|nr:trypsin-like peptidase domain-containing protein [Burkholderiales bacterium]
MIRVSRTAASRIAAALAALALALAASVRAAETASLPPPSAAGQRLFDSARDKLVQLRVLTRAGSSQSTVGSGFLIRTDGTALTNYHVVSLLVMEPQRYRAEYVRVDGKRGAVKLLGFDVVHDLALVQLEGVTQAAHFNLRPEAEPLRQGEKIYSLGNPLDLGFAISEGTYNGIVERRLYDTIHFTGALNPGMSGGPGLDEAGRVIGVNVAGTGGELANLLVPLAYVRALLAAPPPVSPDKTAVTPQLLQHQDAMMRALMGAPFPTQSLGPATVPVGNEKLMRCWGQSNAKPDKPWRTESISCNLQSSLYIEQSFNTGSVRWTHTYRRGEKLGALKFSAWHARSMGGTAAGGEKPSRFLTRSHCNEDFVTMAATGKRSKTVARVSTCVRAHREFEGLFDMSLNVTSVDRDIEGLTSTLELRGVSFANGMRLQQAFVEASGWTP